MDASSIPRELLRLLTSRIYDLSTVEPFGSIDRVPLTRPITYDQLKKIQQDGASTGPGQVVQHQEVNFYAPLRQDSLLPLDQSAPSDYSSDWENVDASSDFSDWEEDEGKAKQAESKPQRFGLAELSDSFEHNEAQVSLELSRFGLGVWCLLMVVMLIGWLITVVDPDLLLGRPVSSGRGNSWAFCPLLRRVRGEGWYLGSLFDSHECGEIPWFHTNRGYQG